MEAKVTWKSKMAFDSISSSGHVIKVDTSEKAGGENSGPSPKELVLQGLVGCTAMDVISILQKMRQDVKSLIVTAQTELTDDHPKVFKEIKLNYIVTGNIEKDKLIRAIELSQNQYCGVSAMLRKNSEIKWDFTINQN